MSFLIYCFIVLIILISALVVRLYQPPLEQPLPMLDKYRVVRDTLKDGSVGYNVVAMREFIE